MYGPQYPLPWNCNPLVQWSRENITAISPQETLGNVWRHFWLLRCMVVEARDTANCLTTCRKALVIRITQAQISTVARQRSPDPPPPYYPGQQTTVPDFPVRLPITVLPTEVASRTYR